MHRCATFTCGGVVRRHEYGISCLCVSVCLRLGLGLGLDPVLGLCGLVAVAGNTYSHMERVGVGINVCPSWGGVPGGCQGEVVKWLDECDMTHSCVRYDSVMYVT